MSGKMVGRILKLIKPSLGNNTVKRYNKERLFFHY